MKKIIIIGSSGAGKSTLARILGEKLNIDVFHLDRLLWQSGWKMTERSYHYEVQKKLIRRPQWIIDGNFGKTLEMRMKAADTIIFLDISRLVCIYQILKRVRKYHGTTRPDMHENCPENFDASFIKWVWNFPKKQRKEIQRFLEDVSDVQKVIILKNKKQIRGFLNELSRYS